MRLPLVQQAAAGHAPIPQGRLRSRLAALRRRPVAGLLASLVGLAACAAVLPASAQTSDDFPQRPIRLLVGYTTGGTTDIVARVIAPKMAELLGQPVVVENRPGAGGNLASEAVARAAPDGYLLQMGTAGSMTINPSIYASMKFDTVRDFAPVTLVAAVPNIMVVNTDVPARSVDEFVNWARGRPGQVFFASSGTGNSPHLTGELFNLAAKVSMVHVPYRGSLPALTDLIGGTGVQVMFDNIPSAIGLVRSGKLRALAVTGARRSPAAPELPTMQEAGLADFQVQGWFGLFAPARTPAAVIDKLHRAALAAMADPGVRKSLEDQGAQLVGNTPAEFAALVETERRRWATVVKAANITPQ